MRLLPAEINAREHGQDKSGSLARARLRLGDHVTWWVLEQKRQSALLDLGRAGEVHGIDAAQEGWGQVQVVKGGDAV